MNYVDKKDETIENMKTFKHDVIKYKKLYEDLEQEIEVLEKKILKLKPRETII
ncbi:hypothetical protein [Acanthamoeba polyphaga mimivirus]|nr:hypothetical protein [Acanthamoeba polyphaga mimivirus]